MSEQAQELAGYGTHLRRERDGLVAEVAGLECVNENLARRDKEHLHYISQLEAACAALRAKAIRVFQASRTNDRTEKGHYLVAADVMLNLQQCALSTDCGQGWRSPDDYTKLEAEVEALQSQNAELLARATKEMLDHETTKAQVAKLEAELAGYREAMQRERRPEWEWELKELARSLEASAKCIPGIPPPRQDLEEAARQLRLMAEGYTMKVNFMPMRVALWKAKEALDHCVVAAADPTAYGRYLHDSDLDIIRQAIAAIDALPK